MSQNNHRILQAVSDGLKALTSNEYYSPRERVIAARLLFDLLSAALDAEEDEEDEDEEDDDE